MFDWLDNLLNMGCLLIVVFVPLGMWKLVEIAVWLWHSVSFNFGG